MKDGMTEGSKRVNQLRKCFKKGKHNENKPKEKETRKGN